MDELMSRTVMSEEDLSVRKKVRGNGFSKLSGPDALLVEPGDNCRYLTVSMKLLAMPEIDLTDADAVNQRISDYFELMANTDMKPTVAGLAMVLNGLTRNDLISLKSGIVTENVKQHRISRNGQYGIKKAISFMEILWENYMQNGKINPVSGIFLGKNNYGYVDKVEHVVTPNVQSAQDFSEQDIRDRYMLPGAGETSEG